jgi:hypothetical protein
MTHDGQIVVSNSGANNLMPDTSDLSSLAAAAETHEGMVSELRGQFLNGFSSGLPDFSSNTGKNTPNGNKMYQMTVNTPNVHNIY